MWEYLTFGSQNITKGTDQAVNKWNDDYIKYGINYYDFNNWNNQILGPIQVKCRLLISSIFLCNEFLTYFGNARILFMAFLKNVRNSLHKKC